MLSRIALIGLVIGGCVPPTPVAEQTMPEPVQVAGPPGGEMDQQPDQPMDPAAYGDPPPDDAEATQDVTDVQIDATLEGYGQWEDDPDAGQVWRPDATLVGADFTPYDSGGSWVYTDDYGWAFNCDYGWGWLPFHYGRWGWFRDHWGWVRGHQWGAAWVDWRHGGGVVGWRPMPPTIGGRTWTVPESHWHFIGERDMGNGHIRGKEIAVGQGMGVTSPVARPNFRGQVSVRPSTVMGTRPRANGGAGGYRPTYGVQQPRAYRPQPAYRPYTQQPYTQRQPAVRQPTYTQPNYSRPPTYSRPTYNPQAQRPAYRPTYTQPSRPTYSPPSRPTYSPPSRPSYSPPVQHSSPPPVQHSSPPPASHSSPPASSSSSSSSSHHR